MKVSVEKLPSSEAVLQVDISWDDVQQASDKAYRKLVQKVDVQGFRRGKAPRSILERKLGKEYIYQEGLDELISETYRDALKEHELTPISQPKLDAPIFEMGQPYHFSLTVPVITPVELGDYHALHFERPEASVTSEEVDQEITALQNRLATWVAVDRPVEYGDRINADLKLTVEEKTISDLKDNAFEITNERHGLFSGMDEHLLGMRVGESKTFSTTIPADYTNEKLAGKQADYEVTLHTVEVKQVPSLDDAFASQVSEGQYETLEDLSKVLSDNILERKKRQITEELRDQALNAVIEQSKFSIHPLLIEEESEEMAHQFGHMLERQHLSMDQYLKMVNKSRDEYLEETRPEAEQRVRRQLVLEEIAVQEQITVLPEELEALFNAYAQMGQELPHTEEQVRSLMLNYRREKTLSRLIELTTDPDPDEENEAQVSEDVTEEATVAHAEAAALVADAVHNENVQSEESVTATSLPVDQNTETVE